MLSLSSFYHALAEKVMHGRQSSSMMITIPTRQRRSTMAWRSRGIARASATLVTYILADTSSSSGPALLGMLRRQAAAAMDDDQVTN